MILLGRCWRWLLAMAVVLCIALPASLWGLRALEAQASTTASLPTALQEGDLIFRRGTGMWSPVFSRANHETGFSHLGVLVRAPQGQWQVLHADADDHTWEGGVQRTPLDVFLAQSAEVAWRQNRMDAANKQAFLAALRKMLDEQTPFDASFRLDDGGARVYCTEYVWLAAQRAGVEGLGTRSRVMGQDVITVDAIYQSDVLGPMANTVDP